MYGFRFNQEQAERAMNFCDKEKIEYQVWNAEEVFLGKAKVVEFEFNSKEDLQKVRKYLDNPFAAHLVRRAE